MCAADTRNDLKTQIIDSDPMFTFRIFIALLLSAGAFTANAQPISAWMKPKTFKLSSGYIIDVHFEELQDIPCDIPPHSFVLTVNGNSAPAFQLPALELCADTHFEGVQLAVPILIDGQLVVYRYWNYWGLDGGSPVGAMKSILVVDDTGFSEIHSQIYYEPGFQYGGWQLREGPSALTEQTEYDQLVAQVEQEFSAEFVVGTRRDHLFSEVQQALHDIIPLYSQGWCQADHTQKREVAGAELGLTPCP